MIDADTFRSVLGRFASGVTIVTTRDSDGIDHGMQMLLQQKPSTQ